MLCQLCGDNPPLENSHVIPAYVTRHLSGSPPFVGMRCADAPNRAIQDAKKYQLLCTSCELLFSEWEKSAAECIFRPFRDMGQIEFEYGSWLHKFMASLSWRTLAVKLGKYENDPAFPRQTINELRVSRDVIRRYLRGGHQLGDQIEQHVYLWNDRAKALPDLSRIDINLVIRQSAVHEIFIEKKNGWIATIHNHAGCFYMMVVRSNPVDLWQGTQVSPAGGEIKQPLCVRSWIFDEFLQISINTHEAMKRNLSEKQRTKIANDIEGNADGARRLIERDPFSNIVE